MSSKSDLDDYYNEICKEMITLKALRDEVTTTGEPRLAGWSQIVKQKEDEIDEMEKELKQKSMGPITKKKLEARLVRCLKAVKILITSKDDISEAMGAFIKEVATGKPRQYPWAQIKKFTSDPKQEIGRGVFGVVYKGTLDGVQVAIKVLNNNQLMDNMEKEFKAEVNAMSKTYHRNLAELYGFCFDPKMKALVYEYMENGSLDQILYKNPSNVPWEKLYQIAIGTAKGLSYLHESCKKRIVHRDIKAVRSH
ncbi:Suppressor of npr1-1 [Thalictrum thalictroides]|uniref:Suppressor of npr1-1 n=1 Tax=Thalictrum thalictroides TaxID=46969 RepID=A0A7J6V554_THATH|nr:Suppressor of npr1-1 [Thalictrum thalictroides]